MITLFLIVIVIISTYLSLLSNPLNKEYSKTIFLLYFIILVLIVGFRGGGVDHDYYTYLNSINNNKTIGEPTFLIISTLIKTFHLPLITLFVIYACLGIGIKLYAIKKYSGWQFVSLLVYFSNFLLLHDINQIRAGVASAIILFAIPYLAEKKIKHFILLVTVAVLFHYSSLIALVLLFVTNNQLTKKQLIFWILIPYIGIGLHFVQINIISLIPFDTIRIKLELYKTLEEMGRKGFSKTNLFNLYFLFKLFIYTFFLFKYHFFKNKWNLFNIFIKIYGLSLFLFPVLSSITPILGYRVSELLGIVEILLFPCIFIIFKSKRQSITMIAFYVILLFSINILHKNLILF